MARNSMYSGGSFEADTRLLQSGSVHCHYRSLLRDVLTPYRWNKVLLARSFDQTPSDSNIYIRQVFLLTINFFVI
jgi:hypothetical protein